MITIIDYGVGNIGSVVNAFKRIEVPTTIAKTENDLRDAKKLILPGVGHFDNAMKLLNKSGMRDCLDHLVNEVNIPILGICVGMQIMARCSTEGNLEGLNWLNATVRMLDESQIKFRTKLPHMGWNDLKFCRNSILFNNLNEGDLFYFLHSYFFECNKSSDVLATTEYGMEFTAAVNHENIFGVQFHPEKSHSSGEIIFKNFAAL